MINATTLIVPGYRGSEHAHWQTWIENQIPGSIRIHQNWEQPVLSTWAKNISLTLNDLISPAWLIAHSFGCLASILAALENPDKVLGLMLVAPADPDRFDQNGVKHSQGIGTSESVIALIPTHALPVPSMLIASDNDPWMQATKARFWGECWGSRAFTLKDAGHINTSSGFGPWPDGLKLFKHFQLTTNSSRLDQVDKISRQESPLLFQLKQIEYQPKDLKTAQQSSEWDSLHSFAKESMC